MKYCLTHKNDNYMMIMERKELKTEDLQEEEEWEAYSNHFSVVVALGNPQVLKKGSQN